LIVAAAAAVLHGERRSCHVTRLCGGDQWALPTSPWTLALAAPFDCRLSRLPPWSLQRERAASVRPVGGGGWFMPCPAAPPDRATPLLGC